MNLDSLAPEGVQKLLKHRLLSGRVVELLREKAYVESLGVFRLLHRRSRVSGHGKAAKLEDLEYELEKVIDY